MAAKRQRREKARYWVRLRKVVQAVTLLVFGVLVISSRRGGWPADWVNLPLRLDPLPVLAHLLSSRTLLAGSAVALLTVVLVLFLGRAWCGWLCPMGTLLDLFPLRRWRESRPLPTDGWRRVKHFLLLTILIAALLGNLTLLFLDPLTILVRTLSVSVWPAVDQLVTAAEIASYRVSWLRPAISTLDSWVRPQVLPTTPAFYRHTVWYAVLFVGLILLNGLAERFWCRYLCPLGGLLGLLSKLSLVRQRVTEQCRHCDACVQACPTGTIQAVTEYQADPAECTLCLDCLSACPHEAIIFPMQLSRARWRSYDPSRRQAFAALGTAVAGLGLFRSAATARQDHPHWIRPPGAQGKDFLSQCIRCGECVRACPTSGLQPAIAEAGVEGVWTPVLIPRLGYCDYSCNACGQVCPVQAIPSLGLEEKRQQVIGKATIDQSRCIPWADQQDCIVCEEMCPLPEKAIELELVEVSVEGEMRTVQRPRVLRELCIGCGICEFKCPVDGPAAIRVYGSATG